MPTLREETCLAPAIDTTKSISMTIMALSDIEEGFSIDDFYGDKIDDGDTNTSSTYYTVSLDTKADLKIYDIKTSELFPTSWCTTYT